MSGKQDKRLRRAARGLAVTLTEAGKQIHRDGYSVITHRKIANVDVSSIAADRAAPPSHRVAQQLVNRKDSLRGIIRTLKKGK